MANSSLAAVTSGSDRNSPACEAAAPSSHWRLERTIHGAGPNPFATLARQPRRSARQSATVNTQDGAIEAERSRLCSSASVPALVEKESGCTPYALLRLAARGI